MLCGTAFDATCCDTAPLITEVMWTVISLCIINSCLLIIENKIFANFHWEMIRCYGTISTFANTFISKIFIRWKFMHTNVGAFIKKDTTGLTHVVALLPYNGIQEVVSIISLFAYLLAVQSVPSLIYISCRDKPCSIVMTTHGKCWSMPIM